MSVHAEHLRFLAYALTADAQQSGLGSVGTSR